MNISVLNSQLYALVGAVAAFSWYPVSSHSEGGELSERDYQLTMCEAFGGQAEVVLRDRTRVDCLTAGYAIEVDFARKWHEAIGQALHYASMTGRRPGIVLILRTESDLRYWRRLQSAIRANDPPIRAWCVGHCDATGSAWAY